MHRGHDAAEGADLNADGGDSGEAGQREGAEHDGLVAVRGELFAQRGVADELVEDGLLANEVTDVDGVRPRHADEPRDGYGHDAGQAFEVLESGFTITDAPLDEERKIIIDRIG